MQRLGQRLGLSLLAVVAGWAWPATAVAQTAVPVADEMIVDGNHLRMCTGSPSGNYQFAGTEILNRVGGGKLVNTDGSLTNLRNLMSGVCTIGFTQSDVRSQFALEQSGAQSALVVFKVVYTEYVHVLCPVASGWSRINGLGRDRGKLIVGQNGTGSAETWRILRQADDDLYGKVERLPDPVGKQSLAKIKDTKDTCMLWVSGINAQEMQIANQMSVNTRDHQPSMTLVDVNDRDMKTIKGVDGKPMYVWKEITRVRPTDGKPGVYDNLMQSSSVSVPTVDAELVVRADWLKMIQANGKADRIIQAIEDASPSIWKTVNPGE